MPTRSGLRKVAYPFFLGSMLACLAGPASAADRAPLLTLEQTIPLHNVSGRIDHMAVDLNRKRLFVAELGNGTVDVVDLTTATVTHRIGGLHEPQGIGYAPARDVLAVANAGDGTVRLYKGGELAPAGVVELGDDADNIRIDPRSGRFIVGYGRGGITTLDPGDGKLGTRVALPAHPEGFQLDPATRRVFVNLPDAHQIAVADLDAGKQVAAWRVPGLGSNFPMALDRDHGLAAVVYRSPARLVLLDTGTGTVTAQMDTCGDADDVFFDARRQRIYVSCGSGSVDTFTGDGHSYQHTARVSTESGARTSLFVPELDRLFVARRAGLLGSEATLLVFRPGP